MRIRIGWMGVVLVGLFAGSPPEPARAEAVAGAAPDPAAACTALLALPDVTLLRADPGKTEAGNGFCLARGVGPRAIAYHVVLPDPPTWNGRLVYLGDGGADGDLDEAPFLIDAGYAYVNSNMGHDDGIEGRAFGFRDPDSEVDFAWRAQHLALAAARRLVRGYYDRAEEYRYHLGCSTGGRQGLLAAQILPDDYHGIVAGAPGHLWFSRMAHRLAVLQMLYAKEFAGNLAFDKDGDGTPEDLGKVALLERRALEHCDAADGIRDGLIEPALCEFDPRVALAGDLCPVDAETDRPRDDGGCFTPAQVDAVVQLYEGSRNGNGLIVYPGAPVGAEAFWPDVFIPHAGNGMVPYALVSAAYVMGYQFYAEDPGIIPPDLHNVDRALDHYSLLPEWGWWEFDIDDLVTSAHASTFELMQGDEADLSGFLLRRGGKLLMFHGWADAVIPPGPTVDYYHAVVEDTFRGDAERAAEQLRLYMVPGMGHCRGGPGPQPEYLKWLEVLGAWVERGEPPQRIVGRSLDPAKPNERPLCPYPQRAVYAGPVGAEDDPANWTASRFECR